MSAQNTNADPPPSAANNAGAGGLQSPRRANNAGNPDLRVIFPVVTVLMADYPQERGRAIARAAADLMAVRPGRKARKTK